MARHAAYILGPLAFLAAALVLVFALLPACAAISFLGIVPEDCRPPLPDPATARMEREAERGALLLAEIRRLERQLLARANCPVAPPPAPPAPEPEPEPEPPADPPPEQTEDQFDRDRWEQGDISIMEGCWLLDSDYKLRHIETGELITVPFWRACFDADGNGTQELRMSNGAECSGPMTADFTSDTEMQLSDNADVPCSQGLRIFKRTTQCTLDQNDRAVCVSRNQGGSSNIRLKRDR